MPRRRLQLEDFSVKRAKLGNYANRWGVVLVRVPDLVGQLRAIQGGHRAMPRALLVQIPQP
jgi:hypothetical protein